FVGAATVEPPLEPAKDGASGSGSSQAPSSAASTKGMNRSCQCATVIATSRDGSSWLTRTSDGRACTGCYCAPGVRVDTQISVPPKPPDRLDANSSVRPSPERLGCCSAAVELTGAASIREVG